MSVDSLIAAVRARDLQAAQRAIDLHVNVNGSDKNGLTPLVEACTIKQNDIIVKKLISAHADVNLPSTDAIKWPPLHAAINYNVGMSTIEKLVEAGASLKGQSFRGRNVLHWVANNSATTWPGDDNNRLRILMATYLLKHRAVDVLTEKDSENRTPQEYAASEGYRELASFLRTYTANSKSSPSSSSSSSSPSSSEAESKQIEQLKAQLKEALEHCRTLEADKDSQRKRIQELEQKSSSRFNNLKESDFYYSDEDLLGEGQGGRVFRVRYHGADIAIKFIRVNDDDEKKAESEFAHELMIMQHIPPHPNVVGFLGGSVSTKPRMLGVALMRGSLEQLLFVKRESPIDFITAKTDPDVAKTTLQSLKNLLWYLVGASAGLVQLHAHNVVHGDVAARNMLVDFNNNCCVCDFGMSQVIPEGQSSVHTSQEANLPLAWSAPETLIKREWSFKTDVYSFGVLIVEVMTRNEPYHGENLLDIVPRILDGRNPHRPHIAGWWPNDLADLAAECMVHQPADRPTIMSLNRKLYRFHERLREARSLSDVYSPLRATKETMGDGNYKIAPSSQYYINYKPFP